jgi:DNA ligase-1
MPDLQDGQTVEIKGSGSKPWVIKNSGGVYHCTCPAWRNQSKPPEQRTCKHILAFRGAAAEEARLGAALAAAPARPPGQKKEVPPLLLADPWAPDLDVTGWWLSEKLDGQRAYWDGKQFWSRYGNPIRPPDWFVAGLPAEPLDGEMWIGRGQFQRTSGLVRRQDRHEFWKEIRYVIFDAPGQDREFEARLAFLQDVLRRQAPPYARALEHKLCQGKDHLFAELAEVQRLGGEGLMLRQPGSRYVAGRSATLLKVKTFHDAEARVLGYQAGKGRHKGRVGALCLRLSNGIEFEVGTGLSDAERANPPAVGSVITFKYQDLTDAGLPRFPVFVRVRPDVTEPAAFLPPAPPPEAEADEEAEVTVSVSAAPPGAAPAPVATEDAARRFEYGQGPAARFWEVARQGVTVTQRFGAVGGAKHTKTETFASEAAAREALEELVGDKFDDGFRELIGPTGAAPPPAPAPAVSAPAASPGKGGGKRYFELVEGTSSKFWEVWVEGSAMLTRYGRIGSGGQTTTKSFADEAAARKAADKLVAEKTGKGYVEKG